MAKKVKYSKSDIVFDIVNMTFLSLLLIIVVYPLIYVLSASFSSPQMVVSGQVWLFPKEFSLVGYETVFKNPDIMRGYLNTIYLTVCGTSINIIVTIMAAYPLSVKDFVGKGFLMGILTFTMFFSGGLIPSFLWINQLGIYDTYWALILPGAVGVYNVILAKTFFQSSIPIELYESATIDGCNDIMYIIKMILPLSKPIIAVLTMYYAVGHWNMFFNALIYLSDSDKYPLQVILRNIILQNQIDYTKMQDVGILLQRQGLSELLKFSLIIVSSVPLLIIYPFVQKHFVRGVMIGAIKG